MRLVTVAGPPTCGKTAVITHALTTLMDEGVRPAVIKLDCLATDDEAIYTRLGIPVRIGLSGGLCPDHFFVCNIEDCVQWALRHDVDLLVTESAGLCNRCSPHVVGSTAVCVIDDLMGANAPRKVGPLLKRADIVVITKGDIVSQAEREVFAFHVRQANATCVIMNVNGITGQGCGELAQLFMEGPEIWSLIDERLRFTMPAALCSYCLGERRIGYDHQMGNVKKMELD